MIASASSWFVVTSYPFFCMSPSITSASTTFFGHPKPTKDTFKFFFSVAIPVGLDFVAATFTESKLESKRFFLCKFPLLFLIFFPPPLSLAPLVHRVVVLVLLATVVEIIIVFNNSKSTHNTHLYRLTNNGAFFEWFCFFDSFFRGKKERKRKNKEK